HRHTQILEGASMTVATLLDPEIAQAKLAAEALGPEEVSAPFIHRDDVLRVDGRANPFHFAPDGAAVGIGMTHIAFIEERLPLLRGAVLQGRHIVGYLQKGAALLAAVNHIVQPIPLFAPLLTLKPGLVPHRSAPYVFVTNILQASPVGKTAPLYMIP